MSKKGFSLDFDGFLDLAEELDKLGGDTLLNATKNALDKSREFVNDQINQAMDSSPYSFNAGVKGSQGRSRKSLEETKQKPIEVNGTVITAYTGVELGKATEVLYLMYGTPHIKKDQQLFNAVKVKGSVKKQVAEIQKTVFTQAIKEGVSND